MNKINFAILFAALLVMSACSPTVKLEAPEEPLTFNVNVKIEHEIKINIDRELESILSEDSGLF